MNHFDIGWDVSWSCCFARARLHFNSLKLEEDWSSDPRIAEHWAHWSSEGDDDDDKEVVLSD